MPGAVGAGVSNLNVSDEAAGRMMMEYQSEVIRLRNENQEMLFGREVQEQQFENLMFENQTLYQKLDNLENVFIGQPTRLRSPADDQYSQENFTREYAEAQLKVENIELKKKVGSLEDEVTILRQKLAESQAN